MNLTHSESDRILQKNLQFIPGGVVSVNRAVEPNIVFIRGKGSHVWDADGNERNSGVDDFGWKLYLDNPLEDVDAPAYIKDSITTTVVDSTLDGRSVSLLKIEWVVDENKDMNAWANCYVSLLPPGEAAYRLESYGYAVDDQNDGYDTTTK